MQSDARDSRRLLAGQPPEESGKMETSGGKETAGGGKKGAAVKKSTCATRNALSNKHIANGIANDDISAQRGSRAALQLCAKRRRWTRGKGELSSTHTGETQAHGCKALRCPACPEAAVRVVNTGAPCT